MRILFLSRWYPHPANNGSKLRVIALLKGLAKVHEISLISFYSPEDGRPNIDALSPYCKSIYPVPRQEYNPTSYKAIAGLLSMAPRSVLDTYSKEVHELLVTHIDSDKYDLVIASQFDMAIYADQFRGTPALLEEIEIGVYADRYQQAQSFSQRIRHGSTWWKHKRYLAELMTKFKTVTVVSDTEKQLLQNTFPELTNLFVVPNCVDLEDYSKIQSKADKNTLIFTGSFRYLPNYEAMNWFIREVLPLIQEEIPQVKLIITGDHANLPIPAANNVKLTGYLPDIRQKIGNAWISLAPIFSGGGTRLKILEAMALHTPVVATPKGAEGLSLENGRHLLIAQLPTDFAQACLQLLKDTSLRQSLADRAYQVIEEKYSWQAVMPRFLKLVEQTAVQ